MPKSCIEWTPLAKVSLETRILWESVIAIFVSLFFFLWALLNTIREYYDDGLECFPLTIAAGVYGVLLYKRVFSPSTLAFGRLIAFGFSVVVLIFVLASILTEGDEMHRAYLIVSAFVWALYGYIYYCDAEAWRLENDKVRSMSEPML
mmetsp:Transcript_7119/g.10608  ORF Transcript_7119/g.10608 Transcript_7119/m.10608 type:complete len:148 (+) Transcript_7119:87-530(+)